MNIAVCVKPVPAMDAGDLRLNGQGGIVRDLLENNPADESALEAALTLRDSAGGRVTLLTMGTAAMGKALLGFCAHGADRAVLVSDPVMVGSDSFATARTLAAALRLLGPFDLVLCGRRAVDGETGQVPPELALLSGLTFATNVVAIEMPGSFRCRRLLEDGVETLLLPPPALVSVCEYSYTLRAPGLESLRRARARELETLDGTALGFSADECGLAASPTRVRRIAACETPLRRGEKTADLRAGARRLAELVRELR